MFLNSDLTCPSYNNVKMADHVIPTGRSTVFFYRFCTDLIAECFVPPVTSALMSKNMWIPLLAAVVFQGLSTMMILIIPETLPMPISEQAGDVSNNSPIVTNASETDEEPIFDEKWKVWMWKTKESFGFATRDATVAALVFTFLISKVGRQSVNILLQYVSKRYGWSLSKAST
jgi:hypothetical protein